MKLGIDKYRTMQAELDLVGINTAIKMIGPKCYQFCVNFEVVKQYRTRSSCNSMLTKMHEEHIKSCWDILGITPTKTMKRINEAYISKCEVLARKSGNNMIEFCQLTEARKQAFYHTKSR